MLWCSTTLEKFLSSIKENTEKISRSGAATTKDEQQFWVVRILSAFVFNSQAIKKGRLLPQDKSTVNRAFTLNVRHGRIG